MARSKRDVGFITQGRHKARVNACADDAGIWVEIHRHNGRPWEMTPALSRALAGLLREAADIAEAVDGDRT